MTRYVRSLQGETFVNPFPGIVALEQALGFSIKQRIGSNEGLPIANTSVADQFGERFADLARLYPDPSALALREVVAAQLRLSVEQIVFDAGADSLILLVLRTVCEAGDVVVTSAGTYPTFRYFAEGLGASVIELPYRDWQQEDGSGRLQPDLSGLAEQAHRRNAKLVYLANPDNPTGHVFDETAIQAFRAALPIDTLLLLDEAYSDFHPATADTIPILANTVRLRTLSKAYAAAGLRLGYALAASEWIQQANRLRIHYAVSTITHAVGLILLQDMAYKQRLVDDTLKLRQQLQETLQKESVKQGFLQILPSATNFIAIRYADPATAAAIQKRLWQQQVAVHRPPHPALQHLLRITAGPAALQPEIVAELAGHGLSFGKN